MISTINQNPCQGKYSCISFLGKSDTFWKVYRKELKNIPLKDTIVKSISDEKNLLGEGLSKKGYNLVGLKNYIVRVYKKNFKIEDLDSTFVEPKKDYLSSLEGIILHIPGKIDIVKKKLGTTLGVENYAGRIHDNEFPPFSRVIISREESLKALNMYEQIKDFPLKSFIQAYKRMMSFCKKPGFQFDIISPNNILIDVKSKKINLIDPVTPMRNNGVHGHNLDFEKIHGVDSLYPVLCDFITQKELLNNLTNDEILKWNKAQNIIIAKSIIAGKLAGCEQNADKLRVLYERIDKYWKTNELCTRYDKFREIYAETINQANIIADAINYKNSERGRIEAIKKLDESNFENLKSVFKRIIVAPHQPKVEFPEILNAVLDKIMKYGDNAKNILPTIESLFSKEIFYTTKKRIYHLFTTLQPSNNRFLEEINKSIQNPFEKMLYKQEFQDLYLKAESLPKNQKQKIQNICQKARVKEDIPQYLIDKLWISRTCTNQSVAQDISLKNMIKAYAHIESERNRIPNAEDLINLHKIILADTPGEEHIVGRLRTPETDVLIAQIFNIKKKIKKPVTDYSASKDVVSDLEKLDSYIKTNYHKMETFELAANIFNEVIRIHPFINGNGRATRLFTEQFLLSKGYRLQKWPEETLYRKIYSPSDIAESLKACSEKIE